jgi:uncharacterized protein (DUF2336 family)
MIVRHYLAWSVTAPTPERAQAISALARAWLAGRFGEADGREALAAMMAALDDRATSVRQALAQAVAAEERAPGALVRALVADQSLVAAPVLAFSPLLTDHELVDCLAVGDATAQAAIASRPWVSATLGTAICEVGAREACVALLRNGGAEWDAAGLDRLAMRFVDDGDIRGLLLAREDLPIAARQKLVQAVSAALASYVRERGWLPAPRSERVAQEACEAGSVLLAGDSDMATVVALARHLRQSGQLTPALLLRSVLSGETRLMEAALAELAEVPLRRVSDMLHARSGFGLAALYRKAGLPAALAPAFEAAMAALHEAPGALAQDCEKRLQRDMVEKVLIHCAALARPELDRVLTLLGRFQAEAAREEARALTARLIAEASDARAAQQEADAAADEVTSAPVLDVEAAVGALDEDIRTTMLARLAA